MSRHKRPVTHRVYAKGPHALRVKAKKVAALVHKAYEQLPWLRAEHRPLVARWAELELIIEYAFAGICQTVMFSTDQEKGEISAKRLVHDYRQLVQTQTVIEHELLMSRLVKAQLVILG